MRNCNEFAPLLSAYFDGELTEEVRAEVRAHLEKCEACRARLGEYAALREGMLDAFAEEEVPAGFTEGVMAAVRAEKSVRRRKVSARRYLPVAACAAVVLLAASLFPGMHRMGSDSKAADTAMAEAYNASSQTVADSEVSPSDGGEQELAQDHYDSVQGSAYYASLRTEMTGGTAPEEAADDAPMLKNSGEGYDDGLVYSCEVREINGEEGLLWVHQHGAVMLELLGAGATEFVVENGGVKDGDAGYYYLPVLALHTMPESITLSDVQAAEFESVPEDAEWVLVYPDDASEEVQP